MTRIGGGTVTTIDEFDEWYTANYGRLVPQIYAYTGDLARAQALVQQAFARALPRWRKRSAQQEPVDRVRRTAWKLATSPWRQLPPRTMFAGQRQPGQRQPGQRQPGQVDAGCLPAPSPARVAMDAALAALPARQRRIAILYYLADASVPEIAAQERLADDAVRYLLDLARASLALRLADIADLHAEGDRAATTLDAVAGSPVLAAFVRYRAEVAAQVATAAKRNLDQVRAIARRRAPNHVAAVAALAALALAALAVAVPAAGYVIDRSGGEPPPVGLPGTGVHPAASMPGGAPTLSPPPKPIEPTPAGAVSLAELTSTTIDLPPWHDGQSADLPTGAWCPTRGARPFYSAVNSVGRSYVPIVERLGYADVDGDGGVPEAVTILSCDEGNRPGEAPPVITYEQVVALERSAAGAVVVLGQVVRDGSPTRFGAAYGSIHRIFSLDLTQPARGVGVEVGDADVTDEDTFNRLAEHQWRWYLWNAGGPGQGFGQSDGPNVFHPVPAEYGKPTVTSTPLVLGKPNGGVRRGSFRVIVTNPDRVPAPGFRLVVQPFAVVPSNYAGFTIEASRIRCGFEQVGYKANGYVCHHFELPAGGTVTYTFTVTSSTANDAAIKDNGQLWIAAAPEQPGIRVLEGAGVDTFHPISSIKITK